MQRSVSDVLSLLQRRRTRSLTICLRVEMTYSMIDLFLSASDCPGKLQMMEQVRMPSGLRLSSDSLHLDQRLELAVRPRNCATYDFMQRYEVLTRDLGQLSQASIVDLILAGLLFGSA